MKKARLALVTLSLSCLFSNSAVYAAAGADEVAEQSRIQDTQEATSQVTGESSTQDSLIQLALGGMSDLGGILNSDMPAPSLRMGSKGTTDEKLAIGATDAAPSLGQHTPDGRDAGGRACFGPGMGGPGMCRPGHGMAGHHPMWGHHFRCPWERLEGAYALTDDQYQKLYDIKGQFIASIVPKGLNIWMLGRKMKDLLNVGNVDTAAVKDMEKQIAAATSDLSMTAMDSIIAANQVLTAEQRKELHKIDIRSTLGGSGHHHHHEKDSQSEK